MKQEYIYRRGYETRPTFINLRWHQKLLCLFMTDSYLYYRKAFVDFIDS